MVPSSFDSNLEGKVLDLLNDIAPDANVQPQDVQAIHRLKKRKNVIVKFKCRKQKYNCIRKRAELEKTTVKEKHGIDNDIYLNESMCDEVKRLFFLCKKLKGVSKLNYYTFFNGNLKVKETAESDYIYIEHITDLCRLTKLDREAIEDLADGNNSETFLANTEE